MNVFRYTSRWFQYLDQKGILSWKPFPYVLLVFGVLAAFSGAVNAGFDFDDKSLLTDPAVTQVWGFLHLFDLTQTRPLTYLTYWINYQLGGNDPGPFHLVDLLLHLLAVLALFHVLRGLLGTYPAVIAAGLFAVHPIQSEAVVYLFARGTLLSALFCFLALNQWLKQRRWHAVGYFCLALLSKEECVTFPIVLLLLALSTGKLGKWEKVTAGFMLAAAALVGARAILATKLVPGSGAGFHAGIGPWDYLVTQGLAIFRYVRLLIVPWGFTIDPDVKVTEGWLYAAAWAGVLIGLAAAAWWFRGLRAGFWVIAGFVLLIPSSTIFPAADLAADRRMYLPLAAFAVAIAFAVQHWNLWVPRIGAAVLIYLSILRMTVWHDEQALWREAVYWSPGEARPLIQLARAAPPEQAVDLLTEAKRLRPNDPQLGTDLGTNWIKMGHPDLALNEYGRVLAMLPEDAQAINNRGVALLLLGQTDAAIRDFKNALSHNPCLPAARMNLERLGEPTPPCTKAK